MNPWPDSLSDTKYEPLFCRKCNGARNLRCFAESTLYVALHNSFQHVDISFLNIDDIGFYRNSRLHCISDRILSMGRSSKHHCTRFEYHLLHPKQIILSKAPLCLLYYAIGCKIYPLFEDLYSKHLRIPGLCQPN